MAYEDFKGLPRRAAYDNALSDKAFNITENPKYDEYQHRLALMVYRFSDKKYSHGAAARPNKSAIKSEIISKQQLAEELQKLIISKFEKRKVQSSFKDNLLGADRADIQSISKYNQGFRFLLCHQYF